MSDFVDYVVDTETTAAEASAVATKVRDWLIAELIVTSAVSSMRSLDGSELLLPGPNAKAWDPRAMRSLPSMVGFSVSIERRVYHTGENGVQALQCPLCDQQHGEEDVPWCDAASAWFTQQGEDAMRCSACQAASSITDWRFLEFEWGFGNLGFGFWNWQISDRLAQEIGRVLGHRFRLVHQYI